mmetsp:Transcript_50125/g.113774  ORF Transcript_50125/g.113774 Transcript_50125/m.113774 type:complete len:201 (+) Transcript_50125:907-1509(+)
MGRRGAAAASGSTPNPSAADLGAGKAACGDAACWALGRMVGDKTRPALSGAPSRRACWFSSRSLPPREEDDKEGGPRQKAPTAALAHVMATAAAPKQANRLSRSVNLVRIPMIEKTAADASKRAFINVVTWASNPGNASARRSKGKNTAGPPTPINTTPGNIKPEPVTGFAAAMTTLPAAISVRPIVPVPITPTLSSSKR